MIQSWEAFTAGMVHEQLRYSNSAPMSFFQQSTSAELAPSNAPKP